jgi:hypothetical protein
MKMPPLPCLVCLLLAICWHADGQIYDTNNEVVESFAGSGFSGYLDGQGTQTLFYNPSQIVADSWSNLFVLDTGNYLIRKITPDGTVSTFAGGGGGSLPGYGTNVSLNFGFGLNDSFGSMTIDHSNILWIATSSGLLRIGSDASVSIRVLTGLSAKSGVCVDSGNNIYFSTYPYSFSTYPGNQIYRWRTNGILELFSGSGNQGSADGNGIFTSFYAPTALTADAADNIYVWDSLNYVIRRINQNRDVATIAGHNNPPYPDSDGVGTNATFFEDGVSGMCADDSGNVILACGYSVRKMSPQTNIVTMAGSFTQNSYSNGAGNLARFNGASGVCVSGATIYVADVSNQRIRSITFNPSTQPVLPADLQLNTYPGLQIIGTVGRTYQIQTSPDMTNWTTRATLLLTSNPYLWIDQNPVSGNKYYRAFLLP